MSTTVQQPGKESRGWVTFKESLYITRAWDWFTTLISRAAEAILLGCFLVSLYSLIPGAPKIAPQVDAAVIIIQSITLDIAGIGLMKMSLRLKLDKKSFPYRLGRYLIAVMFVSIAVAIVRNVTGAPDDNVILKVVESLLLVARALLAVLYGPAIHSLNEILREQGEENSITSQVEERLSQAVQDEMKALTDRLAEMQKSFQSLSMLPELQKKVTEMEANFFNSVSKVEMELKAGSELKSSKFNSEMEACFEQILNQREEKFNRQFNQLRNFIEAGRTSIQEVPEPDRKQGKEPLQLPARNQATGEAKMSREQFVHDCLRRGITTGKAIQERGEKLNIEVSPPLISMYKKTFQTGEIEAV